MTIHLYRVIQPVKDIEAAARFYGKIFQTLGERVSSGRHYFDCGGTILACYDPVADGDNLWGGWQHHRYQYVYFAVPDLEATLERVRDAGAEIEEEISSKPWGERIFYAKDPFGNPLSFVDEKTVFRGRPR